jgi:hypothetical protein
MPQSIVGGHSRNSILATMNGFNHPHNAIFAALRLSPQRPSPRSFARAGSRPNSRRSGVTTQATHSKRRLFELRATSASPD